MIVFGCVLQSCGSSDKGNTDSAQKSDSPQVLNGGTEIKFAKSAPQLKQFKVDTVLEKSVPSEFSAPIHLIVSVVSSATGNNKVILFETQDLTQLYADYITAISELDRASKNLQRLKELSTSKAVAEKELLDGQTGYDEAVTTLVNNESQLRAAGLEPKVLGQIPIGTILAIANVPEDEVVQIKPKARVEIECASYPDEKIVGKVYSLGDVIDPNTRTIKLGITINNPHGKLRAGMFGSARFIDSLQKVMAIPTTGVVREGDGTMTVWVTENGYHFIHRKVKLGLQFNNLYQILDGLHFGDLIVTEGGVFLSNMLQDQPTD